MNPGRWAENYCGMKHLLIIFFKAEAFEGADNRHTDKRPPERAVELISSFKQQFPHHNVCIAYAVRIICHFSILSSFSNWFYTQRGSEQLGCPIKAGHSLCPDAARPARHTRVSPAGAACHAARACLGHTAVAACEANVVKEATAF